MGKSKFLLGLITSIIIIVALTGCKGAESSSDKGDGGETEGVELTFLSLITPNMTEEFWAGIIERFEEENPGVNINMISDPSSTGLNDEYLKQLLASGEVPDILSNISYNEFAEAGHLLDIPIDEDIEKINDYESLLIDEKLYSMQGYVQPHTVIFYNKDLFAEAGIEETPTTWDELFSVSEQLKENDITPLLAGGDWSTTLTFSILTSGEVFGKNPNWYGDRLEGKVSYTDDNWLKVADNFQKLAENDYFNEGALSIGYEELEKKFLNGEAAMFTMGSWFAAAEASIEHDYEIGVFNAPALDNEGGPYLAGSKGTNFSVSSETEHPEEAVEFLKFLTFDPETHKEFSEVDSMFSGLVDPINYDFTPLQQEIFDIIQDRSEERR